jgi:hypothetical protein
MVSFHESHIHHASGYFFHLGQGDRMARQLVTGVSQPLQAGAKRWGGAKKTMTKVWGYAQTLTV